MRPLPDVYHSPAAEQNHFRFRISPDVEIALRIMVLTPVKEAVGKPIEMVANHHPEENEMDAYERVLGESIAGDTRLFAGEDYVEEAWRIVDPVLRAGTPVYPYESGRWGPEETSESIRPPGGWHTPAIIPAQDVAMAAGVSIPARL